MGFFLHDSDSCFVAWRIESGDESPLEPADKSFFKRRQFGRRRIGGEDNLLMIVVERVEGVEEFFLALFSFAKELDVIYDENIGGSELALEIRQGAVLDCAYESVYEFFATVETDGRIWEFGFCFVRNCVEQVCFAESDVSIKEEWIVCVAGCVADRNATGVCESVAGSDNETFEAVIGMESWRTLYGLFLSGDRWSNLRKFDAYEVACDGLCSPGKVEQAVIFKKVGLCIIRAADFKNAAVELYDDKVIEPFSTVDGVKQLHPLEYIMEQFCCILRRQALFPLITVSIKCAGTKCEDTCRKYNLFLKLPAATLHTGFLVALHGPERM